MLKDNFDHFSEPDEPLDPELNKDDLYDEDQFYRESEAVPPAPKLQRELAAAAAAANGGTLANGGGTPNDPFGTAEPASSANPPMRSREGNHLEGE